MQVFLIPCRICGLIIEDIFEAIETSETLSVCMNLLTIDQGKTALLMAHLSKYCLPVDDVFLRILLQVIFQS